MVNSLDAVGSLRNLLRRGFPLLLEADLDAAVLPLGDPYRHPDLRARGAVPGDDDVLPGREAREAEAAVPVRAKRSRGVRLARVARGDELDADRRRIRNSGHLA